MFQSEHRELSWLERNERWSVLQTALSQKSTHIFILIRAGSWPSDTDLEKRPRLRVWLFLFFFFKRFWIQSFIYLGFAFCFWVAYCVPGVMQHVIDVISLSLVFFFFYFKHTVGFICKFTKGTLINMSESKKWSFGLASEELTIKVTRKLCGSGNVLYLVYGGNYMRVYVRNWSIRTLKMGATYCLWIVPSKRKKKWEKCEHNKVILSG